MTDKQKQIIRRMRQAGLPYSRIADTVGLSLNTVKSFCRREGIEVSVASHEEDSAVCKYCGRPLEHRPGKKQKRFCSDKCRSDWWNRNRVWANRKGVRRLICRCCGAVFNSYGNKQRKYCGRGCYIRGRYGAGAS